MKFLLFLLAIHCPVLLVRGFGVFVKYGQVSVVGDGFDECVFQNNGNNYTYKAYDENFQMDDKFLFGLIRYDCGVHNGHVISTFECKPCLFFCNYNELYPKCKDVMTKVVIGMIIGAILSALLTVLLTIGGMKLRRWYNYKMLKRSDTKRIKMTEKLRTVAGIKRTFPLLKAFGEWEKLYEVTATIFRAIYNFKTEDEKQSVLGLCWNLNTDQLFSNSAKRSLRES